MRTYEKHPTADAAAVDKRFTDAELAAEVHSAELSRWVRRARCDNYPGEAHLWDHYERGIHESYLLARFATLPHYDEES